MAHTVSLFPGFFIDAFRAFDYNKNSMAFYAAILKRKERIIL